MINTKFPMFAQTDPRWASGHLGTSGVTIGGYGCVLCSLCTMFSYTMGREVRPPELNQALIDAQKFSYGAYLNVPTVCREVMGDRVKWVDNSPSFANPVPDLWMNKLRAHLRAAEQNFAVIMVDFLRESAQLDTHFLCAWGVNGHDRVVVNDPAFGYSGTLSEGVGNRYYGLTKTPGFYGDTDPRAIWRFDLFSTGLPGA